MLKTIDLSIIIVSWNVKELLLQCLRSIYQYRNNLFLEVIIVDNASTDNSAEAALKQFPSIVLIRNQKNVGFAQACNQGINQARGEYILFLNPDTQILPATLEQLINKAKTIENLGVLGCRLLNSDETLQPSVRRFPSFWSTLALLLKLHILFPSVIKKYQAKDFDYQQEQEVDQVMGAAFLVPKRVVEQIGQLDPNYHLWLEEVDFCFRVKQAGYQVMYSPVCSIIHHQGKSFSQLSPLQRQRQFLASMLYFYRQHKPWWQYFLLWLIQPLSLLISWLQTILKLKMSY